MPTLTTNLLTAPPAQANKGTGTPGKPEAAPEQTFGSVLARQINTEQAAAEPAAANTAKTGKKLLAVAVSGDNAANSSTTLPGNDPAANLITMLQAPVELRPVAATTLAETADKAAGKNVGLSLGEQLAANQTRDSAPRAKTLAVGDTARNSTQKQTDLNPALDMTKLKDAQHASDTMPLSETLAAPRAQDVAAFSAPALSTVPVATPSAATPPVAVATPLGSSVWADDFAQQVTWMASGKLEQSASLHLNPPDLGPMQVVVKVSDSQATVLFSSPHGAVREAIENAMPKLREMMADNGITLGNTSVSDQAPREHAAADDHSSPRRGNWDNDDSAVRTVRDVNPNSITVKHRGMLDTYA